MTGTLILLTAALLADDGWRPATGRRAQPVEYAESPALPPEYYPEYYAAPFDGRQVIIVEAPTRVVTQRPASQRGWRPAGPLVPYERAGTRAARQRWKALRMQFPDDTDDLPPSPYPADWEHSGLPLPGPVADEAPPPSAAAPPSSTGGEKTTAAAARKTSKPPADETPTPPTVEFPDDSETVLDSHDDVERARNVDEKRETGPPPATEEASRKAPRGAAEGGANSKPPGKPSREKSAAGKPQSSTASAKEPLAKTRHAKDDKEKKPGESDSPSDDKAEPAAAGQTPLLTLLGLFASLGANAFLIWVTLGQRSRYRALLRRMYRETAGKEKALLPKADAQHDDDELRWEPVHTPHSRRAASDVAEHEAADDE